MQNLGMNDEIKSQCYNLSLEGYEQKDIAKVLLQNLHCEIDGLSIGSSFKVVQLFFCYFY